jgi:hypothetical protein
MPSRLRPSYAEPRAEVEDAFAIGDCDRSLCPFCGHCHREVLYAFPPTALLNHFVAKARADGVRAILVTPLAVSAPYWANSSAPLLSPTRTATSGSGVRRLRPPTRIPLASSLSSPSTSPRGASTNPSIRRTCPAGWNPASAAGTPAPPPRTRRLASGSGPTWRNLASLYADGRHPPPPFPPRDLSTHPVTSCFQLSSPGSIRTSKGWLLS